MNLASTNNISHPDLMHRLWWNVADTGVIAWRNLMRYVRLPQLLIYSTIQPVMFLLLFTFVFGGAIQVPGVDYINYLVPGILVQTVLFGSTQTSVGLAEDLSKGMIDRFRSLPMARAAVMAGRTLADTVRNALVVLLLVGVGTLIGFRFQNGFWSAVGAIVLVVFFGHAFSWISAFIGLSTREPETAQVAGTVWIFPLIFASSAFVPVESMPDWLQTFAKVQPISLTVNSVRALSLGGDLSNVGLTLAWVVGIILVFVPLAIWQYRKIV
ncbi:MAG: ABC transporter permease [Anaerolineales bacterium]|jgi:ABC-2 type transport system permease protein/oleandomycin transport system permease protein